LVVAAISAGIFNDLGSGSNVDACVITATHTEMLRNYVMPNVRVEKERKYGFRRGTTAWTRENVRDLVVSEESRPIGTTAGIEAMDISWAPALNCSQEGCVGDIPVENCAFISIFNIYEYIHDPEF
jgi:hypothetical protein